jgi:hypothetical protein
MRTRHAILLLALSFSCQALSAEFPTGTLKGTGFIVEKGTMKMTEKDLYGYSSSVTITKRADGGHEFKINANFQRSPTTPPKTDTRVDIFDVKWESSSSGTLVNRNASYKEDRTTFTLRGKELVVKSWVARNQLWETHVYSLAK